MYPSIAIALSAAALISANPIAPLRQRQIQHLQNNLNPNLLSDPIEAKSDHRLYAGSIASNFRPELDSDYPYVRDARKGEVAANADVDDDVPDQNQIMNEISNIIKQNNMKVRNIKVGGRAPDTPVLNDNVREPKAPMDLAVPIVNEQDPNNKEQFERLPRINERIPVVNRGMLKTHNRRNPIANDHEGIVYNEPKVHERVPMKNELNELDDVNNVDAVINKLDANMKAKDDAHEDEHQIQNHGDLIHHDHHHHLHRGADMGDARSEQLQTNQIMREKQPKNHEKPHMEISGERKPTGNHANLIQNKQSLKNKNRKHIIEAKHIAEEEMEGKQRKQIQTKQILHNQLQRMRRNYLHRNAKLKPQRNLAARNLGHGIPQHAKRLLYPLAKSINRQIVNRNHALGTMENRIRALEQMDRMDNRIQALEMEVFPSKHRLPLKKIMQVAPEKVRLTDLENVDNVKDVISVLDAELPNPSPVQTNDNVDEKTILSKLNEISALLRKEHIPLLSKESNLHGNQLNKQTDHEMEKTSAVGKMDGHDNILRQAKGHINGHNAIFKHPRNHGKHVKIGFHGKQLF